MHPQGLSSALAFFAALALICSVAAAAPQAFLTESVQAGYFYNGTLSSPIIKAGYVEVSTGNTNDVLQQIRITLIPQSGTTMQSQTDLASDTAYRNVAASPGNPNDRTLIFVNTTNSSQDLSYRITNASITPTIAMSMQYSNQKGGIELLPEQNTLLFSLSLDSSRALPGSQLVVQARRNTLANNDSMSIISAYAPSGSWQILDTDLDGFNDRLLWSGNLPQGIFTVNFTAISTPNVNYDESIMLLNMDEGQTECMYTGSQTFTGTTLTRSAKGSVREGVEIIQISTFVSRAFIKNIASGTTYMLHGWELYQVGNPTPVLTSSQTQYIQPGETKFTEWHDSGSNAKTVYYSGSFDWEVVWGSSGYVGISRSTMTLPALYEMDSWADQSAVIQSNTGSGKSIAVNVTARHLGHSQIGVNVFEADSVLPRLSSNGDAITWAPSSARVYYSNGSGMYDITSAASILTQGSGSSDGFVRVRVDDLYSVLGHYMGQNDDIIISYIMAGPAKGQNLLYSLNTNMTLTTISGTSISKIALYNITVPGVAISIVPGGGGGGGGGGPAPTPYAAIVKESADAYFVASNMVNVIVSALVIDSGTKGVKDVKAFAYIPKDAEADPYTFSLRLYTNSTGSWRTLELGKDFIVTDRGITKIGKDDYREYMVKLNTPEGAVSENRIDLLGGDKIEVGYKVKVPFGTSYILTRFFGYNYYDDKTIFEDVYMPVRREADRLENLVIEESEWIQGEAEVGKPVAWKKVFRIRNPNNVSVEEAIDTVVFQDSLKVEIYEAGSDEKTKLSLAGGEVIKVSWEARVKAGESKTYVLEATTPPVLETERDVDAVESNKTTVKMMINITLENFAREAYRNVSMKLPVQKSRIIMVSDPDILIEQDGNGVKLVVPLIKELDKRNISIVYIETPPIMATTLDALKYSCNDYARVTILVVPSESDQGAYIESYVVGPEPNLIVLHAELMELGSAKPFEETRLPMTISLSSFPSGKYFVFTNFRKDFSTILSEKREFYIECPGRDVFSISWLIILAISLVIVLLLGLRVYRKKSYEKEMSELRKKVKGI